LSSVVLPAPLAPISRQRLPRGSCRLMSVMSGGWSGAGRPSGARGVRVCGWWVVCQRTHAGRQAGSTGCCQ
jgi:hypothetical protein